jgi:hypothetical protein
MVFATFAAFVAGSITVAPQAACPAQAAVSAEVDRLGARRTLEQVGDAEVTVEGNNLGILIRDGSGAALGSRTVVAPVDCQARAELAAVLIAAWTGEWIKTSLGSPPAAPAVDRISIAPPAGSQPPHVDLDAFGFGIDDGDAGAFGGGLQAGLRWQTIGLVLVVEGSTNRQRALGPVYARYRFLRAGPGLMARRQWSLAFVDAALVPEVVRNTISGVGLSLPQDVTAWNVAADLRLRFGLSLGRVSPFVYMGASWSFLQEHLRVHDSNDSTSLPRANIAAGLGISLTLR